MRKADVQNVCNLAWSVALLGVAAGDAALLRALWSAAVRDHEGEMTRDSLRQLAQVQAHAGASNVSLSPSLPPALSARMVEACEGTDKEGSGRFEDEFSRLLEEVGFEHGREVSPFCLSPCLSPFEGGGGRGFSKFLAIDMACNKLKVAVECDGPLHYLTSLEPGARENRGRENGKTSAKRRLLTQLGWKVVTVPFFDSRRMESREFVEKNEKLIGKGGGARELKKEYLRRKLRKVGVAV